MKNDFITNNEYYEDDDIITLKAATGKVLNFIVIAGIYLDNKFYQIMQPVELLCGMEADELLFSEDKHPTRETCSSRQ